MNLMTRQTLKPDERYDHTNQGRAKILKALRAQGQDQGKALTEPCPENH
jgi:hypothetical protein